MDLAELFDVDPNDPEVKRAIALAEQDHQLLRSLVALRQSLKLSQRDVADRLGITQPTVADFERYDSDPKLSTIRRYAQVVGLLVTHRVEVDPSLAVVVPTPIRSVEGRGLGTGTVTAATGTVMSQPNEASYDEFALSGQSEAERATFALAA